MSIKPPIICVVGGGPAGLMAAGQAARAGAQVVLLEKMDRPGRKLQISGNSRGNITNTAPLPSFIKRFNGHDSFLKSLFRQFFSKDLSAFFKSLGIDTVAEIDGRVFPVSNKASLIVDALVGWARQQGVEIRPNTRAVRLLIKENRVKGLSVSGAGSSDSPEEALACDAVIIATGGASYPATGSTGDGFDIALNAGHTIVPLHPGLVALVTEEGSTKDLQGLSLSDVKVRLLVDNKRIAENRGEMLFTHYGLSGPAILAISRHATAALSRKNAPIISLDLKPELDEKELDRSLVDLFTTHHRQGVAVVLKELLPRRLVDACLEKARVPVDHLAHQVTADERKRLRLLIKDFKLAIASHRGNDEAMVTAGGVNLDEVEPVTLESKIVKGLFFAGEVLDLDAETGGYNLQAAFSTGWIAGRSTPRVAMEGSTRRA